MFFYFYFKNYFWTNQLWYYGINKRHSFIYLPPQEQIQGNFYNVVIVTPMDKQNS